MTQLMSKYDKVEDSSEVESLIFELHSLKNKSKKSKIAIFNNRKASLPSTLMSKDQFDSSLVPNKLRRKIKKFMKRVDSQDQFGGRRASQISENNLLSQSQIMLNSIPKRPPPPSLPPSVKFIHQDSDLYLKYQDLCLYYEEARKKLKLQHLKQLIDIKTPSKIEHNIGLILLFLVSNLTNSDSKLQAEKFEARVTNKPWITVLSSIRQKGVKKVYTSLRQVRSNLELYPIPTQAI